jgi:cysteine desulfurase
MSKKIIYLDYSATTPLDGRVWLAMLPYLKDNFANASSIHQAGLKAKEAVEQSRETIAKFLGSQAEELYFTSGATESNNWAILGLVKAIKEKDKNFIPHIITSKIEHEAILEPLRQLEKEGAQVTYLPVDKQGLVAAGAVARALRPNTVLVTVMYANNEVGTIQPIAAIGKIIRSYNQKSRRYKIYFHTDATQAPAYCDCSVDTLGVDLLSLSAHKIYGPKGVGLLYVKKGTPLQPLMYGGGQQGGWRSGTYNVAGIVGLGKAVELLKPEKAKNKAIKKLRDYLIGRIKKKIPSTIINGDLVKRLPSNAHFIFKGVEGESVLLMLSQKGLAISTGSACSSGSLLPSHVLLAMGLPPELAHGSIRVTIGRLTTKKELDSLIRELPPIIKKLRAMSPLN